MHAHTPETSRDSDSILLMLETSKSHVSRQRIKHALLDTAGIATNPSLLIVILWVVAIALSKSCLSPTGDDDHCDDLAGLLRCPQFEVRYYFK